MTFTQNTELYEKMKVPFSDINTCNKELESFFEGVKALREKHKIENLTVCVNGLVINEDKQEKEFMTGFSCGNMEREKDVALYALQKAIENDIVRKLKA